MTRLDLSDPAFEADPFPALAEFREEEPVVQISPGMYMVTRYEDIKWVLKDWRTFNSRLPNNNSFSMYGPSPVQAEIDEIFSTVCPEDSVLIQRDPPYQAAMRAVVARVLAPREVRRLEPHIHEIAHELMEPWIASGRVEFVDAFADLLPATVTCDMFGAPRDLRSTLRRWSADSFSRIGGPQSPERQLEVADSVRDAFAFFLAQIEDRRGQARDDVWSVLLEANLDGRPLTDGEIVNTAAIFLVGGIETTADALGSSFYRLASDAAQADDLREHPERIPAFVEEILRLETPNTGLPRQTSRDVEIAGTLVPKGSLVLAMFASANRDDAVFEKPDAFVPERKYTPGCPHMTFGYANHFCLGAELARTMLRISLNTLLPRMRDIELDHKAGVEPYHTWLIRGYQRLSLRFKPT